MEVLKQPQVMRAWAEREIGEGHRIGLVPTMGYLHAGHLSLVSEARDRADKVVTSIFVNPTQFGPSEDLSRYPRDLDGDLEKLEQAGVDCVFVPADADMYPPGFDCYIVPDHMARVLCGASRPNHFRGVCTVVALLFRITRAHVAVFGEKDFQQLQIIRRMVKDLWLDVEVVGMPIVREADGLAMSSRNAYLSADERSQALVLSRALSQVRESFLAGERRSAVLVDVAASVFASVPAVRPDYMAVVDAESLAIVPHLTRPAVCAVAAFVGKTRLIDNQLLA